MPFLVLVLDNRKKAKGGIRACGKGGGQGEGVRRVAVRRKGVKEADNEGAKGEEGRKQ